MPRLSVGHHFPLEGLQLVFVVPLNVNEADGHLTMPTSMEHLAKAPFAYQFSNLQLLKGDVPLLEKDAGLAGLAWEVASGEEREIHFLKLILRLLGLLIPILILQGDKCILLAFLGMCKEVG